MIIHHAAYLSTYRYFRQRFKYGVIRSFANVYLNHFRFGQIVIDRFAMYAGKKFIIDVDGQGFFDELDQKKEGFLMYDFRLSEEYSKAFKLILLKTELKKLIGNDFDDLSCYIELLNDLDIDIEKLYILYEYCCYKNQKLFLNTLVVFQNNGYSKEEILANLESDKPLPFINPFIDEPVTFSKDNPYWDEYITQNRTLVIDDICEEINRIRK